MKSYRRVRRSAIGLALLFGIACGTPKGVEAPAKKLAPVEQHERRNVTTSPREVDLLVVAQLLQPSRNVESKLRTELREVLGPVAAVRDVQVFTDEAGWIAAHVALKTPYELRPGNAHDTVISSQGRQRLEALKSLIDLGSFRVLTQRRDLSIDRMVMGGAK